MAVIAITEIHGLENVGLSINTMNNNFIKLQNGINNIESFLNTTPVAGALSIGNIEVPVGSGSTNDVGLIVENSATITGDIIIGQSLTVNGIVNANNNINITGNSVFEKPMTSTPVVTMEHRFNVSSDFIISSADTLVSAVTDSSTNYTEVKSTNTIKGKTVLSIDTSTINTSSSDLYIKIGSGIPGQLLYLRFVDDMPLGESNIRIHNTNFKSIYDGGAANTSILINQTIDNALNKSTITLYCVETSPGTNEWVILNTLCHNGVTLTY